MVQKRDNKSPMPSDNLRNRLFGQQESETGKPQRAPGAATQPTPSSNPQARPGDKTVATIGATMSLKGDLAGKEDILIKGKIEGSVVLNDNDMVVDESGQLEGSVIARHVLIRGEINGEIQGLERVTIAATGRVQGTIAAPRVVLEDGGRFKGMIDMPFEKKSAGSQPQKSAELSPATPKRVTAAEAAASS